MKDEQCVQRHGGVTGRAGVAGARAVWEKAGDTSQER